MKESSLKLILTKLLFSGDNKLALSIAFTILWLEESKLYKKEVGIILEVSGYTPEINLVEILVFFKLKIIFLEEIDKVIFDSVSKIFPISFKVLAGIVTLKVLFSSKLMIFLANLYESVATHSKTLPLALKLTPVKIGRVSLSLAAKQVWSIISLKSLLFKVEDYPNIDFNNEGNEVTLKSSDLNYL